MIYNDEQSIIKFHNTPNNVKFWMIRTKQGFFYEEYIHNKYVALGWNIISLEEIQNYNKQKDKAQQSLYYDSLKKQIEKAYSNKQPSQCINKSKRFIEEISESDILMIVGPKDVTFAIAGEYFEEKNFTVQDELEANSKIEANLAEALNVKCPYVKRRRIEIVRTIGIQHMNPNLHKALNSLHGLSSLDSYSYFVLSSMYNCYTYENSLNLVFNVRKESKISARDFSSILHNSTELMLAAIPDCEVYTKSNVNSPGDIVLQIMATTGDIVELVKDPQVWMIMFILWVAIAGGKIGPVELSSLPDFLKKLLQLKSEKKIKEEEAKQAELNNKLKEHEVKQKHLENLILAEDLKEKYIKIMEASNNLKIDIEPIEELIDKDLFK